MKTHTEIRRLTYDDLDAEGTTTSVERAGIYLGIERGLAYRLVRAGELPSIRLGRKLRVPTAALRQLLGAR